MQWPETTVQTPEGPQNAVAPLVISASRATDIPAFHAKWFMNRLRAGYCLWENPFNAKYRQYVSFANCKAIVFWSKNPKPLLPALEEIETRGYQFYFQYTLNNYEAEKLEPRVPKLARRIETFQKLSDRIGRHRVIWRFDPIILGGRLSEEEILERIGRLMEHLAPYTEKLVFSFVDWYRKTQRALNAADPSFRPPSREEMASLAQGIVRLNEELRTPLTLATCAEELDLRALGITHNRCIDPALLMRLCPTDAAMQAAYGYGRSGAQGLLLPLNAARKDAGQRAPCGCAPSKDIGRYNTCMHLCAYCYANQSQQAVINNMNALNPCSEKL